jgi:hypothetical protein
LPEIPFDIVTPELLSVFRWNRALVGDFALDFLKNLINREFRGGVCLQVRHRWPRSRNRSLRRWLLFGSDLPKQAQNLCGRVIPTIARISHVFRPVPEFAIEVASMLLSEPRLLRWFGNLQMKAAACGAG